MGYLESNVWTNSVTVWASNPNGDDWGSGRSTCYDWSLDAACAGFSGDGDLGNSIYSFRYFPDDNPDCVWTNSDSGTISNFDLSTGQLGCATDNFQGQMTYATLAPALACDGANRIRNLDALTVTAPTGISLSALHIAMYDGDGNLVTGFEDVTTNPSGILDLSSISVTSSTQHFRFVYSATGMTKVQAKNIHAVLTYAADAPEFCVTFRISQTCPEVLPETDNIPQSDVTISSLAKTVVGGVTSQTTDSTTISRQDGAKSSCTYFGDAIGENPSPLNGEVVDVAWSPTGQMYIGGVFSNAGSDSAADNIARWNARDCKWESVAPISSTESAISNRVTSLEFTPSGKLLVGGHFQNAAGIDGADYVAVFDPVEDSWSSLPLVNGTDSPINGRVRSIAIDSANSMAYLGGGFGDAGGLSGANYVVGFNLADSTFEMLGSAGAVNDQVNVVEVGPDGKLYMGFHGNGVDGVGNTQNTARWSGTSWEPIDGDVQGNTGIGNYVWSYAWSSDGRYMYVAGSFDGVRKFDTTTHEWSTLGDTDVRGIRSLYVSTAGTVYAAGSFSNVGVENDANYIAQWTGENWTSISNLNTGQSTSDHGDCWGDGCWAWVVKEGPHGQIFIGGDFVNAGGLNHADYFAFITPKASEVDSICDWCTGGPTPRRELPTTPNLPPIPADRVLKGLILKDPTSVQTPSVAVPSNAQNQAGSYVTVSVPTGTAYRLHGRAAEQGIVTVPTNTVVQTDMTIFTPTDIVNGYLQLPDSTWIDLGEGSPNDQNVFTLPATEFMKPGRYEIVATTIASYTFNVNVRGVAPMFGDKTSRYVVYVVAPKATIQFAHQSSKLTKTAKKQLSELAIRLRGVAYITATGYTETDGKSAIAKKANLKLSKARAKAVAKYLKSKGLSVRIIMVGKGMTNPVSKKYQKRNRRVTITYGY
jgi:hypothetical protein